jgi:hypothetical protein
MELKQFSAFQDDASREGVLFFYSGYFSQNIVSAMADAVRHRLKFQATQAITLRKVFSTFVEMSQNIVHYSADPLTDRTANDNELRFGAVSLGQQGDSYFVACGNPVLQDEVPALKEKIDRVLVMSADEIKQAYREKLRSESDPASKGAGLGLLTLARDARRPIHYAFEKLPDDTHVFFYLKAVI